MKKFIYLLVAILSSLSINAQINLENFSGSATEGAVFAKMRKTRSYGNDLPTVGSPYVNENFAEGEVFYKDKSLGISTTRMSTTTKTKMKSITTRTRSTTTTMSTMNMKVKSSCASTWNKPDMT